MMWDNLQCSDMDIDTDVNQTCLTQPIMDRSSKLTDNAARLHACAHVMPNFEH